MGLQINEGETFSLSNKQDDEKKPKGFSLKVKTS